MDIERQIEIVSRNFNFATDSLPFKCFIAVIRKSDGIDEFWFLGYPIASFLQYKNPQRAIRDYVFEEYKCTWDSLDDGLFRSSSQTPSNFQSHSTLISEPGLYALVIRSKMPTARQFSKWVFQGILPSLRNTGQYSILKAERDNLNRELIAADREKGNLKRKLSISNLEKNNLRRKLAVSNQIVERASLCVERYNQNAEQQRQHTDSLIQELSEVVRDAIAKPRREDLRHALAIHRLGDNEYVFTRRQLRYMDQGIGELRERRADATEVYRNDYVPNAMNVLNVLKEKLRDDGTYYEAKCNGITVFDEEIDIVDLVEEIV